MPSQYQFCSRKETSPRFGAVSVKPGSRRAGVRAFRLSTACTVDGSPSIKWAIARYTNHRLSNMLLPANAGNVTSMLKC